MKLADILERIKETEKKIPKGTRRERGKQFPNERLDICRCKFLANQESQIEGYKKTYQAFLKLHRKLYELGQTKTKPPSAIGFLDKELEEIRKLRSGHIHDVEGACTALQRMLPELVKHVRNGSGEWHHKELRQVLKDLLMLTATPVETIAAKNLTNKETLALFRIPARMGKKYWSKTEVATYLDLSTRTLERAIKAKRLNVRREGRKVYIPLGNLIDYIEKYREVKE